MMEDKKFYEPKEEEMEIDLMEYVRKIWAARKLLLKVAGIAAIVGIVVAFSIPKQYTVKVTLSPEASKMGRSSSLANMASMLGLGNAMNNEANALNLTMTEDIISSTPFVLELFDTRVQTIDGEMDTTLVAYLATQKRPWWNTVMSLPSMAIGGIKSLFTSAPENVEEPPLNPFQLTKRQMGQANAIRRTIVAEVVKSGMTTIEVTMQDPLVAATVADVVVTKIQEYITKYKTSKAKEDCKYWEQLYKERQNNYYKAQEAYAKYSDANQGVVKQSVKIEQERLQNEMNLAFQVFTQVATQLQLAKAKEQEEKPVFAILEPASVPLYPTGTSSKIIILGFVFLALMGTSAWILFGKDLWLSLKENFKEEK